MTIIDYSLALAQHATHLGSAGVDLRRMQRDLEAKIAPVDARVSGGGVMCGNRR